MKQNDQGLRPQQPLSSDRAESPELADLKELQELKELGELEELDELRELDELEDEPEEGPDEEDLDEEDLIVGDLPGPVPSSEAAQGGDSDSEEKVRVMASAADAVRAENIVALDLRSLTIISDFFLICTGKSSIQLRAIADRIEERMRDLGYRKLRIEGYQEATWILLDYGDVVCHVMAAEQRAFYDLEAFWGSAPRLELDLTPEPSSLGTPRTSFASLTPAEESFIDATDEDTL